jgi:protein-tyrosine phosphatase
MSDIPTSPAILFVCMGNICRSPTAEGVFRHRAHIAGLSVRVDSAGTHDYHIGTAPDVRTQAHAAKRGYDLSPLRARQVQSDDFERFDYLLAMDHDNLALLKASCPAHLMHKLGLLMQYADKMNADIVPDPYYGSGKDFDLVLDYVEAATDGLVANLIAKLRSTS